MLPIIATKDNDFIYKDTGKVWKYIGIDGFALPKLYLASGEAGVKAYFDEWDRLKKYVGIDHDLVCRAFCVAAPPNLFAVDPHAHPDFYSKIAALVAYANERNYRLDLTGGDYQIVIPQKDGSLGQQQHINELCAAITPLGTNFIQDCNEPFKNGMNPSEIITPQWGQYLRSSGCYGDGQAEFNPVLDFIDFHPSRDWYTGTQAGNRTRWPKFLYDLPVSTAVLMGDNNVPTIFGEPEGFDKINGGSRTNSTQYALLMGSMSMWCAGVTFHSTDGQSCTPMEPETYNCAVEFLRGTISALIVR
jgi:hypothetical protein